MVVHELVDIGGKRLIRYNSNGNFKIKCDQDGNIYPIAYVVEGSDVTFSETNEPLNEIIPGVQISASQVIGLSEYISSAIDMIDDIQDGAITLDMGGAG